MKAVLFAIVILSAVAVAGCASDGRDSVTGVTTTAREPAKRTVRTLRRTCDESWYPTKRTFATGDWRADSVVAGPVTFFSVRPLADYRFNDGSTTTLKILLLVKPDTPVSITVAGSARDEVGFLRFGGQESARLAPDAAPQMDLEGCPATPRAERVYRDIDQVGYPSLWMLAKAACIPVEVRTVGAAPIAVTLPLGTRTC